jgi:predicted transposase YdaD
LKNLESFENIPQILNEPIFSRAFNVAAMANFTQSQRDAYQKSKLDYIGIQQITATAEEEGFGKGIEQGREQERIEMVLKLWKKNKTRAEISDLLDIPIEIITQIIEKYE